jgi:hypothetical protein
MIRRIPIWQLCKFERCSLLGLDILLVLVLAKVLMDAVLLGQVKSQNGDSKR